jgi:hypothetical protein
MFSANDLREKLRLARFRAQERVACSLYKLYGAIYVVRRELLFPRYFGIGEFKSSRTPPGAQGHWAR